MDMGGYMIKMKLYHIKGCFSEEIMMAQAYYFMIMEKLNIKEIIKMVMKIDMGVFYNSNDTLNYNGTYFKGKPNGNGTFYYGNGKIKYEGNLKDGLYDGYGLLYYYDGILMYKGIFLKGKFNGLGMSFYENGKVKCEGNFKMIP